MEEVLNHPKKADILLEPVRPETRETYCLLGEKAYRQHYLHLWPKEDPSPYMKTNFAVMGVLKELKNAQNLLFIIRMDGEGIGIAKLVRGRTLPGMELPEPIYLEKVYLLKKHTGKGYGTQVLSALHAVSSREGGKSIYLLTMKKGRALAFYQKLGYRILREEKLPFENAIPEERGMYLLARALT
jgi:GNAT superfamily N-acetyltransferase